MKLGKIVRNGVLTLFIISATVNHISAQWVKKTNGINANYNFNAVDFVNDTLGFAAGSNVIFRTKDAGETWSSLAHGNTSFIYSIHFVNENIGFVADAPGTSILKTIDGGDTWTKITSTVVGIIDIFFVNDTLGFVGGDGGFFSKTTDGGQSWTSLNNTGQNSNERIVFLNSSTGFVAGRGIAKTIDGGANWQSKYSASNPFFYSIFFSSDSIGYACGVDGLIVKTSDAGDTWVKQVSNETIDFKDVFFLNDSIGYVVGRRTILTTEDGGLNWRKDSSFVSSSPLESLQGIDFSSKGLYTVGFFGAVYYKKVSDTVSSIREHNVNFGDIKLYPNPVINNISIDLTGCIQCDQYEIRIIDQLSRVVFQSEYSGRIVREIDLSELDKGIYLVQINAGGASSVSRIIKR